MIKVEVLLSTYNGQNYLEEQLRSLYRQKGVEIDVFVRDDGSSDNTTAILDKWQEQGLLKWYTGDNLRPARSFMNLIMNAQNADYYAFCDQDDVWLPDKLYSAVKLLVEKDADLYYSSYTTVDEGLNIMEINLQKPIMNTLGQAMVFASVTGCTMVFSNKLWSYAKRYNPERIMMHDSWLFKVALAMDLGIIYDSHSHIYYRQHDNNVIGNHQNALKKWSQRFIRLWNGVRKRYDEVYDLYEGYKDLMPQKQMNQIIPIINYHNKSFLKRLMISSNKCYKTGVMSKDILFKLAILLKRY